MPAAAAACRRSQLSRTSSTPVPAALGLDGPTTHSTQYIASGATITIDATNDGPSYQTSTKYFWFTGATIVGFYVAVLIGSGQYHGNPFCKDQYVLPRRRQGQENDL